MSSQLFGKSPSIAIVGASARAASSSSIRAGFRPVTADLFADADLRHYATATRLSPYPDGCVDWLRAVEPPAWMYTGALENHPDLIDQMGWIAPLWGNSGDVLAQVRSPWQLEDALRGAGLLFPETRSSPDGLPQDGTWLAKTYQGASGSGVREFVGWVESYETHQSVDTPTVGLAELDPPYKYSSTACFQRRIVGTPCSAVFVAADGTSVMLGVTRQLVGESWLGAHGFQYAGSIGQWPVSTAALATMENVGNTVAARFELVGLFGVDMIVDDGQQVWTLEVNPRYTASVEVIERATGVHAIAAHAAACVESRLPNGWLGSSDSEPPDSHAGGSAGPRPQPPIGVVHGKAILFARRDVVISSDFAEAALAEALRTPWPSLADVSPGGTQIDTGRPILTFFADGATADEVERKLRERVTDLERQIY